MNNFIVAGLRGLYPWQEMTESREQTCIGALNADTGNLDLILPPIGIRKPFRIFQPKIKCSHLLEHLGGGKHESQLGGKLLQHKNKTGKSQIKAMVM